MSTSGAINTRILDVSAEQAYVFSGMSVLIAVSLLVGSTTVQPHDDPSLSPVELGASIFVKVNKNLWRTSEEFGLERIVFGDEANAVMGLWNGDEFVLTVRAMVPVGFIVLFADARASHK